MHELEQQLCLVQKCVNASMSRLLTLGDLERHFSEWVSTEMLPKLTESTILYVRAVVPAIAAVFPTAGTSEV
jgi:hypothetical protein